MEIGPLFKTDAAELNRVIVGYTSPAYYRVDVQETPQALNIHLELVPFAEPYVKRWSPVDADSLDWYLSPLQEGFSFAAYEGGQMVGVAIAEARAWHKTLFIREFHIAEAYQRKGIGRQLMETVLEQGRKANQRIAALETQNTNAPAIDFYRALGYHIEGIDLSYYSNEDLEPGHEIALFMKRRLV